MAETEMTPEHNHDEDGSMMMVGVAMLCFIVGWAWGELERLWRRLWARN